MILKKYIFLLFGSLIGAVANAQSSETETTSLDEIIVEEQGEPETRLPLGIGVSGQTLSSTPGAAGDPLRGLQSLPGFTYTDDSESLPAVRGSRPDDNYLQADFAPVDYLFHIEGLISVFNTDLIESFDIYQSAYGPEFSGVTGAVFDVKLRDPKTDRLRGTLDVSLFQTGVLVEGPVTDSQSFYLSGRVSYLDVLLGGSLEEEDGVTITQFPKYTDYQGKYVWKYSENDKLTFQFNGASDVARAEIKEDSIEVDTDPIAAGSTSLETMFNQQSVVWDSTVSDKLSLKSLVSYRYSEDNGKLGGAGYYDVLEKSAMVKSHAFYKLNSRHDVSAGMQVQRSEADVDVSLRYPTCGELDADCFLTDADLLATAEPVNNTNTQAFVKDNWYVTDRFTLFPGLSFQQDSYFKKRFVEPRIAVEYSLSEDVLLSAGAGQYHQAPGVIEGNKELGNRNLEYSSSLQAQVGIKRYFSNSWEIQSELYYKTLDDLVTSDSELRYSNNARGRAFGLDTLIRKNLTDKFSGWVSISLSKATREDKPTGEVFVFENDQPFNVSLVGNYRFNQKWSVGAKLWAHSGAPVTPVVGAIEDAERPGFYRPVFGRLNSDRFPTYHRIDLRVDRTFSRKRDNTMSAYFELLNIMGTENALEYNYNADYTEKEIEEQLTGLFSFGFKATF